MMKIVLYIKYKLLRLIEFFEGDLQDFVQYYQIPTSFNILEKKRIG